MGNNKPEPDRNRKLIRGLQLCFISTLKLSWGGDIGMMTKTERLSTPASASSDGNSRPLGEAAIDMAKRFCRIRVPRRAWLVGLGLAVGIILTTGGSASADDQSSSRNANAVIQLFEELNRSPSTI